MQEWKDLLSKLAEGIKNEPLLAFVALIVVVLALLGAQILPDFRPLIYLIVAVVVLAYAARLLGFARKERSASEPVAEDTTKAPTPAKPSPMLPTKVEPPHEARDAYLDSIIADCRPARLVGLDPRAADPSRGALSLEKLYVSLDTLTQVRDEEDAARKKRPVSEREALLERERTRPLPALEALVQAPDRRMVLLGEPGSGKSTFVRYTALRMAQALRDPSLDMSDLLPGWRGQAILPVIVPLGRFAESLPVGVGQGSAELVEAFLHATLGADDRARDYAPSILDDLKRAGGLILFDGLDEVADLNLRPAVVQAVDDFASRYGRNRAVWCLVTCRTFSYTDPRWQLVDWTQHYLAPLDDKKISYFVEVWHTEHARIDPARAADYEDKRKKLRDALRPGDRRRLYEIAPNPLILTLMAVVHVNKGDLPDTRALVYEECVDLLLLRWESERAVLGKPQKRSLLDALGVPKITLERALWEIAYRAHSSRTDPGASSGDRRAALVTEDLLDGILGVHLKDDDKVQTFLSYCESANGLLMLQGVAPLPGAPSDSPPRRVYTFPHPTFEEYLAARYLLRMSNVGREVRDHLDRSSDRWREVIMLLGEHFCFRDGDFERMDAILKALAPDALPKSVSDEQWRAIWMAGDLLTLYRRASPQPPAAEERVRGLLRSLIEVGALTARERTAAGDALADVSDPRFRADAWLLPDEPLLGFVEIPEGPFLLGSDPKSDKDAYEDEQPQDEVHLPVYYIARYPVTVAQFRAFVESGGYSQSHYWVEAQRANVWRDGRVKGRYDDEPRDRPIRFGGTFELANHPVVGITWYEALAYARWLTERLIEIANQRISESTSETQRVFWEGLRDRRLRVTLPSEAEWEKAARGRDGRIYPWGNDFDSNKTNSAETGIGTTSTVGCFPNGVGPYGVLDMSGNVWEWTRSHFKEYPYRADDGRDDLKASRDVLRVLRGGSFRNDPRYVRCADRSGNLPGYRDGNVGVRVVASPF